MRQRISLITLGVADLNQSRSFYEALGWDPHPGKHDEVIFFQAGDMVLGLWDRAKLANDGRVTDSGGWGGVTLALNLETREQVDAVIEEARSAGATISREPAESSWGGYSSVFLDPDGHPWEIAHNPFWTITDDGAVDLG